jgi:hypothetical protein
MHPPLDHELDTDPHVFFTPVETWNPNIMDQEYDIEDINITEDDCIRSFGQEELTSYGEFNKCECSKHLTAHQHTYLENFEDCVDTSLQFVHVNDVTPSQHDFNCLKLHFGFVPSKQIQKNIEHTTQYCWLDPRLLLQKHFKSQFPAANIPCLNEIVATDTFFSDVSAYDGVFGHGGSMMV